MATASLPEGMARFCVFLCRAFLDGARQLKFALYYVCNLEVKPLYEDVCFGIRFPEYSAGNPLTSFPFFPGETQKSFSRSPASDFQRDSQDTRYSGGIPSDLFLTDRRDKAFQ